MLGFISRLHVKKHETYFKSFHFKSVGVKQSNFFTNPIISNTSFCCLCAYVITRTRIIIKYISDSDSFFSFFPFTETKNDYERLMLIISDSFPAAINKNYTFSNFIYLF